MLRNLGLSEKEKKVSRLIYSLGSTTRQQLHKMTRYTLPTIYRIIEDLLRKGLVVISGLEEELGKGRPTERIEINPRFAWILAVHISRLGFRTALVDLGGHLCEVHSHLFLEPVSPEEVVDTIAQDAQSFLASREVSFEKVLGIGIAVVGPLDYQQGRMKGPLHFFGGNWADVPISQMLRDRFNKPLIYNCNASACLLGHYIPAYYNTYANIAYITLGSCIGSGLVLNRTLPLRRKVILDGLAHMTIEIGGKKCTCGSSGCVEAYVSKKAILDTCQRQLKAGVASSLQPFTDSLTIEQIALAAQREDRLACAAIDEMAAVFACCLSNYLRVVDLEAVILGGSLIETLPGFFDKIHQTLTQRLDSGIVLIRSDRESDHVLKGIASQFFLEALAR